MICEVRTHRHYLPHNRPAPRSALTSRASSLAQEEVISDRTVTAAAAAAATTAATEATVAAYLESWNETDPARRQAAIARAWRPRARYRDPLMASDGAAGIDAMLAAVRARFPGFVLKRISTVDAHNGSARFAWSLDPRPENAVGLSVGAGVF